MRRVGPSAASRVSLGSTGEPSGARRLKDIKRLIGDPSEQDNFAFAQKHPLIRDLRTYSDFISSASTYDE